MHTLQEAGRLSRQPEVESASSWLLQSGQDVLLQPALVHAPIPDSGERSTSVFGSAQTPRRGERKTKPVAMFAAINESGISMKLNTVLSILLIWASLTGVGYAAGGPMNQDLTSLSASAQKAVDAGKRGDAAAFVKEADEALTQAKAQSSSSGQQRIVGKLKKAVAAGTAGNLPEGVQAVEEAMTDMKKAESPRFGGGS